MCNLHVSKLPCSIRDLMYNMLCRVKLIIREGSAMQRWVFVVVVVVVFSLFVLFCFVFPLINSNLFQQLEKL